MVLLRDKDCLPDRFFYHSRFLARVIPVRPHSFHDHSNRNAVIGSIRVAFLAGIQTATSATAHRKIGVRTNAVGSHVFTPNRNPVRNFVSQKAPPIPMTSPIPASSIP